MHRGLIAVALILSIISTAAQATCDNAKVEFREAVEIYKTDGRTDFLKRMLRGGPLENDQRALSQAQALGQIEDFFGGIQSASVLSTKQIGNRSCYLISVMEYEDGPAFAVITYYRGSGGIAATSMFFQTEPEQILPKQFLVN